MKGRVTVKVKQFKKKATTARCNETDEVVTAVEVFDTFETLEGQWRVVKDSKGRIWVEGVNALFPSWGWHRVTNWGIFEDPNAAVIACHLATLVEFGETWLVKDNAHAALCNIVDDNVGLKRLAIIDAQKPKPKKSKKSK